jgi:colanic acid/amylovoran biosynthesis protein
MSQGLGPADDPALRERAAEVLPRIGLVAARDRLTSLSVLDAAGVDRARVVVTGDDALAPAHAANGQRDGAATGIGVGLRVSDYSGVGGGAVDALGRALTGAAARHGGELVPIPISLYPHEADSDALATLIGDGGASVDTPAAAIEQASACRVVVTGSYHAAVFALAQGIPVVGLTSSAYYGGKLEGLADLFPGGCAVIPLGARDTEERIGSAVDAAWETAHAMRGELLAAAEGQIAAAEGAYSRLAAALGGSVAGGPQVTSNDSMSASDTRPAVRVAN